MKAMDEVHRVAFDGMLLLPGEHELPGVTPESLPAADRERAFNIAVRRLAFQVLYELDAGGDVARIEHRLESVEGLGPMALARVRELAAGAWEARQRADAEFETLAPEWPAHRQAAVDRAILRLGWYEIDRGVTPGPIVISEAVELARHFSTEKSPPFINALLDGVHKRAGAEPA